MANDLDLATVYRSLFAAYPDALLLVDRGGSVVLANPAAAELLGYSIDELCSLKVEALVPDAVRSRHAQYRDAYGHNPRSRPMGTQMELVARRRDGTEVVVEIALSPLQEHGLPFVVAAIRGIGAYPRVQQALRRARYSERLAELGRLAVDTRDPQALLRRALEVAAQTLEVDMALLYRLEPNRLELRVAACHGVDGDEVEGTLAPNRPDSPAGFAFAAAAPVIVEDYRSERRFSVPPALLRQGLVSALSVPLSDRGLTIGVLAVRSRKPQRFGDDEVNFLLALSSLLASGLQRADTEEALNHSQRLETVGQLTGGIAHDFNNLLTVIQGNLQVLEELPQLQHSQVQQLVAAATRASKRGADLTGKLLAFARRQVLQPNRVDVSAMLHSLADMLRRTLDQRIRIAVDAPATCPHCLADPGQLESALLNIAINARDAMADGGGALSFRAAPSTELLGGADAPEDCITISVSDSGTGMPEHVRERAFEPFFTTKEKGRGTGLGLSTVYGFVTQSKGRIELDSTPGHGTTVTLHIPRWRETAPDALAGGADAAVLPAGSRVLLVEDDTEVRKVVHTHLQALRCTVTTCPNAEQTLSLLENDQEFDLLLTDIALGAGMRGTELARRVQQRHPQMAVLLMSGFSPELLEADSDEAAPRELLRKPFTREQLAQAMVRALASQRAGRAA